MDRRANLLLLLGMEICAGLSRGSYLVCIGWTTLVVTDKPNVVGLVFIIAMLTTALTAPLVGILSDRYNRKRLVLVAHGLVAIVMAAFGSIADLGNVNSLSALVLVVIVVSFMRALYQSSHDGLIHANVSSENLVRGIAIFRSVHLLSTAAGTVAAGYIISLLSPEAGFLFSSLASLLLLVPVIFVRGVIVKSNAAGYRGYLADLRGGIAIFLENRTIRSLALLAGLALPIGQLSNALLSSYIRDDLSLGSEVFGIVDSAWAMGGLTAAAIIGLGFISQISVQAAYFVAVLVGVATVAFSFGSSVLWLVLSHAAMGFTVWFCRILIDGQVLRSCRGETVGRSRSYIDLMFSIGAIFMCASPSVIELSETRYYFLGWGLITVSGALVLLARNQWALRYAATNENCH